MKIVVILTTFLVIKKLVEFEDKVIICPIFSFFRHVSKESILLVRQPSLKEMEPNKMLYVD